MHQKSADICSLVHDCYFCTQCCQNIVYTYTLTIHFLVLDMCICQIVIFTISIKCSTLLSCSYSATEVEAFSLRMPT